jgi:hypothetical protein
VDKPLRDFFLELKRVAQFVAPGPAVFASRADLEDAAAHTADVPISAALELSEDVLDAVKDDASAQMDAVKLAVAAQGLRKAYMYADRIQGAQARNFGVRGAHFRTRTQVLVS